MRRNVRVKTNWKRHKNPRTGGAASSSAGADVDMRVIHAGKRPLEPGGDADMVCGLDVCDELNECPSDVYVNDCEGDYTDEVTGVTLLRDDVGKARTEEMKWYEKFKAYEEVTDEVSRTGRKPISCRWRTTKVTMNVWNYEVDWSHVKSNRKGQRATSWERHRLHSYVM